jgi:hypothetical protein
VSTCGCGRTWHTFELKWFSILSVEWRQQLEGFTDKKERDLREQFGETGGFQLATLLGHSSPELTKDWYLEPFNRLQVDYIFSLLDEEERAGVDQFVGKVTQDTDPVLTPVRLVSDHAAAGPPTTSGLGEVAAVGRTL